MRDMFDSSSLQYLCHRAVLIPRIQVVLLAGDSLVSKADTVIVCVLRISWQDVRHTHKTETHHRHHSHNDEFSPLCLFCQEGLVVFAFRNALTLTPSINAALLIHRRERAQIGQDLFTSGTAVPLQFPASFTFVFRAFTTLDGIGKTLDRSYDLTKIASPYLKELLDLKDGSAYVSVLKSWQKRLG